jgi:4-hydroxy-2-oxoheptanedioate aldolase
MKALDAGAGGVIVPMINSVAEAEAVVGACRYPPEGFRSMGPTRARVADSDWRHPLCVVMVETVQAVEIVDDILSVAGIDAVFVGPNDLAVSAGLESGYEGRDPGHRRMIERIAESAREHHVTAGIMCGTPEVAKQWHDVGYQMLALDADTRLLMTATEQIAERAKKLISPKS